MLQISQLYNTVRYLKGRQVVGQLRTRLRGRFERPAGWLLSPTPSYSGCCWPRDIEILPPGCQANSAKQVLAGRFCFLNSSQKIGWMPDWHYKGLQKLWQYNLHYFEWLWALDYVDAKAVALDWIANYPPVRNQVGWEPYPVSLRVMNLCGVFFGRFRSIVEADPDFLQQFWKSIYLQCQWLMGRLEVHLLGNHYFENAAALAFVGSCFEGPTAHQWLIKGLDILCQEIPEQIPSDGMHFELSPMYHSRILYLLTILMATENPRIVELVTRPLQQMMWALQLLTHSDGQIALLNDSAFSIFNKPGQLLDYAEHISEAPLLDAPIGPFKLSEAGYYGWRDVKGNYLVCDVGKIGPDYIPGHAHADIFNFELSLRGHRVIVDTGVFDYLDSDMRRYCRSTAAHNTVEFDGQDQCEMWGVFRVAKRGYPRDVKFQTDENGFQLSGWHTGYQRLSGRPVHHRTFDWNRSGCLKVFDKIQSDRPVKAVSRLHLAPACRVENVHSDLVYVSYPAGVFRIQAVRDSKVSFAAGWYCPEFGKKLENKCIVFTGLGTRFSLAYSILF